MIALLRTIGRWLGLVSDEPTQTKDKKPVGLDAATQAYPPPDSRRLFPDRDERATAEARAREITLKAITDRPAAPLEVKVASLDNVSTLFYMGTPIDPKELSADGERLVAQGRISFHWNEAANVGIIISENGALHADMAPKLVSPAYGSHGGLATEGRIVLGGTRHRSGYYRNSTRFSMLPGEVVEKKFLNLVAEQKVQQVELQSPASLGASFDPDQARPGTWSVLTTQQEVPARKPRAKKRQWISLREPGSTDGMAEQLARYHELMAKRAQNRG